VQARRPPAPAPAPGPDDQGLVEGMESGTRLRLPPQWVDTVDSVRAAPPPWAGMSTSSSLSSSSLSRLSLLEHFQHQRLSFQRNKSPSLSSRPSPCGPLDYGHIRSLVLVLRQIEGRMADAKKKIKVLVGLHQKRLKFQFNESQEQAQERWGNAMVMTTQLMGPIESYRSVAFCHHQSEAGQA
jgi:hypothetical protein